MALDEAIARAVGAGRVAATVRFYAWRAPTVSLGCLQAARGILAQDVCRERGIGAVRRPTGGRAVLHDEELTYSLCAPLHGFWGRLSVAESFCLIGEGIAAGLRRLGVAAIPGKVGGARLGPQGGATPCFQIPAMPAILVDGKKLVGSAQRRWEGVLLQHGSLLLGVDLAMHQAVFPAWPRSDPGKGVTSLKALLPTIPSRAALEQALLDGWGTVLNLRGARGELTETERRGAERLVAVQYGTAAWTWRC
jgi:lipoate-protein ligase A